MREYWRIDPRMWKPTIGGYRKQTEKIEGRKLYI